MGGGSAAELRSACGRPFGASAEIVSRFRGAAGLSIGRDFLKIFLRKAYKAIKPIDIGLFFVYYEKNKKKGVIL